MTPVTLMIEPWPRNVIQFKVLSMITISEMLKVIGENLQEILCKQLLTQTRMRTDVYGWMDGRTPTHIWVMGNHSKSRYPPSP